MNEKRLNSRSKFVSYFIDFEESLIDSRRKKNIGNVVFKVTLFWWLSQMDRGKKTLN
jgi:hypothetical protein